VLVVVVVVVAVVVVVVVVTGIVDRSIFNYTPYPFLTSQYSSAVTATVTLIAV